jgi:hypothetical protein
VVINNKIALFSGMFTLSSILLSLVASAADFEFTGKVGVEQRVFSKEGNSDEQLAHSQASLLIEPEFYWNWNGGDDSILFKPFYRQDERDHKRSHGDIREFSYIHAGNDWELRTGIRKEFWGVTEFQHLVDVINQTDAVEDFDGEDKLGQLMVNLSLVNDWGIVDLYLLPGFRERTFAGSKGRLRGHVVSDNNITYESSAKDKHLDAAIRWSHNIDVFDIGAHWFHGTNRDPVLTPIKIGNSIELQQHYNQMDQFGVDAQATINDWLWKFETVYRTTDDDSFWATQAGFEFTIAGVFNSNADLGLLIEYGWDSRGNGDENSQGSNIQNDVFLGGRIALNDTQSSELLMGLGTDVEHNAYSFLLEANRRFGESVKVSIDVRLIQSTKQSELLYIIKDDDHLQLAAEWYF